MEVLMNISKDAGLALWWRKLFCFLLSIVCDHGRYWNYVQGRRERIRYSRLRIGHACLLRFFLLSRDIQFSLSCYRTSSIFFTTFFLAILFFSPPFVSLKKYLPHGPLSLKCLCFSKFFFPTHNYLLFQYPHLRRADDLRNFKFRQIKFVENVFDENSLFFHFSWRTIVTYKGAKWVAFVCKLNSKKTGWI